MSHFHQCHKYGQLSIYRYSLDIDIRMFNAKLSSGVSQRALLLLVIHKHHKDLLIWFQVSYAEILSGGILRLQVSEAEVNNINIRFLDRKT
jgi:hypothetical protein